MQKTALNYEAMGRQIRVRRKAMRMTQEVLAQSAGISLSFLGHIERGSRKASIETLVAISAALKATPDDLLIDTLIAVPERRVQSGLHQNWDRLQGTSEMAEFTAVLDKLVGVAMMNTKHLNRE